MGESRTNQFAASKFVVTQNVTENYD